MPTKKVENSSKKIQSYPSFWFPLKVFIFATLTIERSFLFSRFGVFEWNEENFDRNVLYWLTYNPRGIIQRDVNHIFMEKKWNLSQSENPLLEEKKAFGATLRLETLRVDRTYFCSLRRKNRMDPNIETCTSYKMPW